MVRQAVAVVIVVRQAVAVRCAAVAVVKAHAKHVTVVAAHAQHATQVTVLQPRMPANTAVVKAHLNTYVATLHLRISVYGVPRY